MRKRLVLPAALLVAAIVAAVLAAGSSGRVGVNGPAGKSAQPFVPGAQIPQAQARPSRGPPSRRPARTGQGQHQGRLLA